MTVQLHRYEALPVTIESGEGLYLVFDARLESGGGLGGEAKEEAGDRARRESFEGHTAGYGRKRQERALEEASQQQACRTKSQQKTEQQSRRQ